MATIDEIANTSPPRLRIYNLNTNQGYVMQFNPTMFEEALSVNYDRPQVLGQSHQEMHYLSTGNLVVPMELFFISRDPTSHTGGKTVKKFLYSLCYPSRGADAIVNAAPPRALVVWPGVLSLNCKVTQLNIRNQRFNLSGEVVQFTARCAFEEARNVRWTSEDAAQFGVQRTADAPPGST